MRESPSSTSASRRPARAAACGPSWRAAPQRPSPGHRLRLPPRLLIGSAATGAGAALGLALYLLATREQLLAVAVVLASLYPAIPVLLGLLLLKERLTPLRTAGLLGAVLATVLLSLG
ncbi:EamA family transporter [Streptomyces sp. NPDC000229]|uniref:EamA family transporter n=1 Tax=Streptomyces sp. NPDC000229 TaxID=3154247 RepID=UPI003332D618